MPKRWPPIPAPTRLVEVEPQQCLFPITFDTQVHTRCKHGAGECEECGTTDRRDVLHSTRGGVGSVGRLFRKR